MITAACVYAKQRASHEVIKVKYVILLMAFLSTQALAQVPAHMMHTPAAGPAKIGKTDSSYLFEMSRSGVNGFMDHLAATDQATYQKLKSENDRLNSAYWRGHGIAVGGIVGGIALMSVSIKSSEAMWGGLFLMTAVPLIGWNFIVPDQTDYLNFINQYNQIKPSDPVTVSSRRRSVFSRPEVQAPLFSLNF